jgi:iron(III) transport system permease protein
LRTVSRLPLISPPFIFSLAMIIIAGRRGLIYQLFGISPIMYGWPGLIAAQVLSFLPLGFLLVNNVLQSSIFRWRMPPRTSGPVRRSPCSR